MLEDLLGCDLELNLGTDEAYDLCHVIQELNIGQIFIEYVQARCPKNLDRSSRGGSLPVYDYRWDRGAGGLDVRRASVEGEG